MRVYSLGEFGYKPIEMMNNRPNRPHPLPIEQFLRPLHDFIHEQASGGIVLLASAIVALFWANSLWSDVYYDIFHTEISLKVGSFGLSDTLLHWINDGLMVVFFFVIGLEIKREVRYGELSSPRLFLLPVIAAVGGMVVPAMIYAIFNFRSQGLIGWGIPMATDIAFALGILSLLGSRVPLALKSFLVAVAIIDDLGAILVIAVFHTEEISFISLLFGAGILAVLVVLNRVGVRHPMPYILAGLFVWLAFLQSGVHATIAGVLVAATIPGPSRIDESEFLATERELLDELEGLGDLGQSVHAQQARQSALIEIEQTLSHVWMPLQRLEHSLHPWVAFVIMPLFALANAGVSIGVNFVSHLLDPISLGIIVGMVIGKQAGITFAAWLAVRLGFGVLPRGVTWPQIYAVAWLGGIGFTMSLFISNLAFSQNDLLTIAKIGITTASLISGVMGFVLVHKFTAPPDAGKKEI